MGLIWYDDDKTQGEGKGLGKIFAIKFYLHFEYAIYHTYFQNLYISQTITHIFKCFLRVLIVIFYVQNNNL